MERWVSTRPGQRARNASADLHPVDVGQVEVEDDQSGGLEGGDVDGLLYAR